MSGDIVGPDFADWLVRLSGDAVEQYIAERCQESHVSAEQEEQLRRLADLALLCCPEDQECDKGCEQAKTLCLNCRIPLCRRCQLSLQRDEIVPESLGNGNWYGYVQRWIYEVGSRGWKQRWQRHTGRVSHCSQ